MSTTFIIIIALDILATIIALGAEINVKSKFNKYTKVASSSGLTGKDVAERILRENDITEISVNSISQTMGDHYYHSKKELNLCEENFSGTSIAAIAVAAHEAGHAIQYKQGYFGIKLRNFIIPVSNFVSRAFLPLLVIGLILSLFSVAFAGTNIGEIIVYASLICLGTSVIANLVTLPVEFDASKRAIQEIERMNLSRMTSRVDINAVSCAMLPLAIMSQG